MTLLLYISFTFLGIQLVNVLINLWFRQPLTNTGPKDSALLSILVPARNEEQNIGNLLNALKEIPDSNIEILICNDASTDETESIVKEHMKHDERVRLIQAGPLPEGWSGKNHACDTLAKEARGSYMLFIDADVILKDNILNDALAYSRKHRLGLLSVFPQQIMKTRGELCSVPIMNYILLTLLPLIFVKKSPFKQHCAANGQFMLFDAQIYKQHEPHRTFRSSIIEDITIAKYYKSHHLKVACITGDKRIQCRMYTSYQEATQGFSKNIFMFFGNIPPLAFLFWLCAACGILPVLMQSLLLGLIYAAGMLAVQAIYAFTCKQKVWLTILCFPAHLFCMLQIMLKACSAKRKRNSEWKGRNIYLCILMLLFSVSLSAQNNRFIYKSYVQDNMNKWKLTMDSLGKVQKNSQKEILDIVNYEYGYIGWCIGRKNSAAAQKHMSTLKKYLDLLEQRKYATSTLYAYKAAMVGFEIGMAPYKAPFIGSKSLEYAKKSLRIDSMNVTGIIQMGNIAFHTPSLLGGSKQDALMHYLKALRIMERNPDFKVHNWNYLHVLACLINTCMELKQYETARKYCLKALSFEPGFVWVKQTLYPQVLKKLSS